MRCDAKKIILNAILEYSDILFSSQASARNNESRHKTWHQIHATAIKLGIYASDKNWTYMRDVVWQNIRKSTLTKLHAKSRGKTVYLDICDQITMKILDIQRQSHILRKSRKTLNTKDNLEKLMNNQDSAASNVPTDSSDNENPTNYPKVLLMNHETDNEIDLGIKAEPGSGSVDLNCHGLDVDIGPYSVNAYLDHHNDNGTNNFKDDGTNDSINLQKKYLELKIRNLEIVNYKEMLQVMKLERELGISNSDFLQNFNRSQ